jgi:Outer membrane protein beta-barrel domain
MRVSHVLSAAVVAVIVSTFAPAAAQSQVYLGLGGGVTFPVSNLSDNHGTGYNVLADLGVHIPTTPLGVRFDGMFNQIPGSQGVGSLQIWTANANLVVSLAHGPVVPYLIGGGGYYNGSVHLFAGSDGVATSGNTHANDFGLNGGGGVKVGLGPVGLFVEARYHYIFDGSHNYEMVPITAGVRFGG